MPETISFDRFTPEHLDGARRLSLAAGWPHRRKDWDLVFGISRGVVALAGGAVVGTAFATPFGPVAMANMIIVDEAMRGRGLGRSLMASMMDLVAPQQWRLVATQEGLPLYEKLGFQAVGQILQLQGQLSGVSASEGVVWASAADLPAIAAMDLAATGAERSPLLARLAVEGRLAVIRAAGKVAGYGCLRGFGRGELAGPVIAQRADDAKRLLSFLFANMIGDFVRVDTTEACGLAPWLQAAGLTPVGGGIAMQRGDIAVQPSSFIPYALAAQALG